jgi:hypothetical protein
MQYERAHMVAPACHGGRRFDRARRTASRRRAPGSEKRNPAKAGIKFVHFGGILQTAGDRGGSGSRLLRLALLDAPRALEVQSETSTVIYQPAPPTLRIVHQQSGARVRAHTQAGPVAAHIKNPTDQTRCGTSRIGAPCRSLAPRVTAAVGRSPAFCTAAPKSDTRESI